MEGKGSEMRYFMVDDKGHLSSVEDRSKFDTLPWYKRLYGYFNINYKNKFITVKCFKIGSEFIETDTEFVHELERLGLKDSYDILHHYTNPDSIGYNDGIQVFMPFHEWIKHHEADPVNIANTANTSTTLKTW